MLLDAYHLLMKVYLLLIGALYYYIIILNAILLVQRSYRVQADQSCLFGQEISSTKAHLDVSSQRCGILRAHEKWG